MGREGFGNPLGGSFRIAMGTGDWLRNHFIDNAKLVYVIFRKVAVIDSPIRDGDTIKLTHQTNPIFDGARWHNP
jgi:hypothetical protein